MSSDTTPMGNNKWLQTYGIALEDRVSCDTPSCNNEAVMYTRVKCCGEVIINCRQCMMNAFRAVNLFIRVGEMAKCHFCDKVNNPRGWLAMPKKLVESEVDNDDDL